MMAQSHPTEYALGPTYARRHTVRFETKPGADSGAGYERWRTCERRDHTPRRGTEDVFVYHHRLLWVAMSDPDEDVEDVLEEMEGKAVHHINGIKWDNPPSNIELMGWSEHSSLTSSRQSHITAPASADREAARAREKERRASELPNCERCGDPAEEYEIATVESTGRDVCIGCIAEEREQAEAIQELHQMDDWEVSPRE